LQQATVFVNKTMEKKQPTRPIAGGTHNGTRLQRYAYWRTGYGADLANRLDFYLSQAGEFHCKPNYQTGSHELGDHTQVFYHLTGQATLTYAGRSRPVKRGDLFMIPPLHPFVYESRHGGQYHWVAIQGNWPRLLGPPELKYYTFGFDDTVEAIFIELREYLILRKPGYPLRAIGAFYELMARVEDLSQAAIWPESAYPETVRNAIVYLRENTCESFSAVKTAKAVGVSASHLRALFEKWLGESPRRFHMGCRIELAKHLLSEQRFSVFEVASHIGFADTHHFSRVFKQMTGISPSQYAQKDTLR
jgi:AraC-like DNA-binding protein